MKKISILGFGSWGIALSCLLHANGHEIVAWDTEACVRELQQTRRNPHLPDVVVPEAVKITNNVETAGQFADIFVLALPSKELGSEMPRFAPYFSAEKIIVIGAKGLEETRQIRISEYLRGLCESRVAALTGPSHAEEVVKNVPTTVVAAARDEETAKLVQRVFSAENFRVYTSTDLVGAEMGGALKNVIAIAAGISDGLGFGDNTKAALITRGIAEITRLGVAMGARAQTFAGLSGIGDLIVTCASRHSRNWRAGFSLAGGASLAQTLTEIGMAVEGVDTAKTALSLARKYKIEMPIVEEINKVLFEGKPPKAAVVDLMQREPKDEISR